LLANYLGQQSSHSEWLWQIRRWCFVMKQSKWPADGGPFA
jgi:hypothetical protein